ncbi:MAG: threonine/serine exporter family protein [Anaerotignaceae bacterium]
MTVLIEGICSFFACLFFAIIYNTPKKELPFCGLAGGLGYGVCYYLTQQYQMPMWGAFWGTTLICIMSRYFATRHKMPVMMYVLPAIFPIVPGAGIYYALYAFMINDIHGATKQGIDAFKIAGVIVLAMLIILSQPKIFSQIKNANKSAKH